MADLLPTIPAYAPGIVALDPTVVQCHDCGATAECPRAVDLILAGFHFHGCESEPVRRCPDCLAHVRAACTERRHD